MIDEIYRKAKISECGKYRYELTRMWDLGSEQVICWVMLNPSTADDKVDDPTIRRCMGFSRRLGFNHMQVVNLFGFRTTKPEELLDAPDPTRDNQVHLRCSVQASEMVVVAWGILSQRLALMAQPSVAEIRSTGVPLKCLGRTKAGYPRHPLYVKSYTPLDDFELNL